MPSNADARVRGLFYQRPDARPTDDMPDWLKSQFTQTSGQFQREDGSTGENWLSPGHIIRDANGNRVVMLGDNGQLEHTNDLAMNPDYDPAQHAYYDPDLGWVASGDYVNDNPWQETKSRNRGIATAVMLAAAGAGAYGAMGAGAEAGAGAGWAEGGGFGAGAISPEAAAGVGAGEAAGGAGAGWAADGGFGAGGLAPEEMGLANYEAGAGLAGPGSSMLTPQNIARGLNTARSLLGGGGGGRGQGQGGMPIMGGFGAATRIGDHRKDDDPFGLKASGWGGGFVKEDPKQKIAQALMERNPWSYQG